MVIEDYRGNGRAIYERSRANGRMLPDGLEYVNSWVEPNLQRCFQVMRTDDFALLQEWAAKWDDLVGFEFVPVLTSAEASALALGER
jgi:hypothetical protein